MFEEYAANILITASKFLFNLGRVVEQEQKVKYLK